MYVYHICKCVPKTTCVCHVAPMQFREYQIPWNWVTGTCGSLCGYWEPNLGPLQKQEIVFPPLVFGDSVSLCNRPGCPGTCSVDQVGLELRDLPSSASQVRGLRECSTTPSLFFILFLVLRQKSSAVAQLAICLRLLSAGLWVWATTQSSH